jgi:protein gp37
MSGRSKIEWTDRSDWNPIRGCTRVSPGCGGPGPHGGCYAEAMAARFSKPGMWGHGFAEMKDGKPRWTGKVELQEDRLPIPVSWRKPATIFVNSTSDIFHEALPDESIDKVFDIMARTPWHTYQVLTKRADRMRSYLSGVDPEKWIKFWSTRVVYADGVPGFPPREPRWPLPNLWLGVSAERQQEADGRIPHLLQTPAAVRFVSCEPLLGPIHLTRLMIEDEVERHDGRWSLRWDALSGFRATSPYSATENNPRLDWVIVGGESGPRARPYNIEWARSLRDQCVTAGAAFNFKQHGEWLPGEVYAEGDRGGLVRHQDGSVGGHKGKRDHWWSGDAFGGVVSTRVGKNIAGRLLDGREHNEFPRPSVN